MGRWVPTGLRRAWRRGPCRPGRILADGCGVDQQDAVPGRGLQLERGRPREVALIEPEEFDRERAPHMRLVPLRLPERQASDLHGAVVPRRIPPGHRGTSPAEQHADGTAHDERRSERAHTNLLASPPSGGPGLDAGRIGPTPSHGVYRLRPAKMFSRFRRWSRNRAHRPCLAAMGSGRKSRGSCPRERFRLVVGSSHARVLGIPGRGGCRLGAGRDALPRSRSQNAGTPTGHADPEPRSCSSRDCFRIRRCPGGTRPGSGSPSCGSSHRSISSPSSSRSWDRSTMRSSPRWCSATCCERRTAPSSPCIGEVIRPPWM